jgi:hypothetical protein
MKRTAGILLSVAAALVGGASLFAADDEAKPDYYPLKVGTKWHYELNANGKKMNVMNAIAKTENIDGKELSRLETTIMDRVAATEHLTVTDKGVFRNRINGIEITPPVCLLKFPVKDGESWDADVKIGEEKVTFKAKAGKEEEVEVPAGKYKAVTSELQVKAGGVDVKTRYWFAKDVGVVKQTMEINGQNVDMELSKFEKPENDAAKK